MRFLTLVIAFFLCATLDVQSTTALPNPLSAPSSNVKEKVEQSSPAPNAATGKPHRAIFQNVKFSVTLPNSDWKVDVSQNGVALLYEKGPAVIFIIVKDDIRALEVIAKESWTELNESPVFTVAPLRKLKNPTQVRFNAYGPTPDGKKAMLEMVVMRNPGNPLSQSISLIGNWMDGDDATKAQVLGVIASIAKAN